MFCENCGATILEGSKFCVGCGAKTEVQQSSQVAAAAQIPRSPVSPAPVYAPPAYVPPAQTPPAYHGQTIPGNEVLRVGQYIGMFLLMCIPILNIILLFVWSFGGSVNLNKKNYARAALILCAIMLILWIVGGAALVSIISEIFDGMGGYY